MPSRQTKMTLRYPIEDDGMVHLRNYNVIHPIILLELFKDKGWTAAIRDGEVVVTVPAKFTAVVEEQGRR